MFEKRLKRFHDYLHHDAAGGAAMFIAAVLAMAIANSSAYPLYDAFLNGKVVVQIGQFIIDKPAVLWINDGLMALFFFSVGLEIKREFIRGHLRHREQVLLPAVATLGGILVPAIVYAFVNKDDPVAIQGWAIPAATDIAFAMAALSFMGKRVSTGLKVFLLSVAIFDDLGAIIIIAMFYSESLSFLSLTVASIGLLLLFLLNRFSVRYQSAYVVVGLIFWAAVLKSGIHATLAGFLVALFVPQKLYNPQGRLMADHLERSLHPWVTFIILPLFAFSNAGLNFSNSGGDQLLGDVSFGVLLGLILGKPLGVFTLSWVAVRCRYAHLPKGANWLQLLGAASLCGIGFTMSLFIGVLSFDGVSSEYLQQVKFGVLVGSAVSAIFGVLIIYWGSARIKSNISVQDDAYCHWIPGRR